MLFLLLHLIKLTQLRPVAPQKQRQTKNGSAYWHVLAHIDRPVTPVTPGFRVVFLSFSRSHALHGCVHRQLCQCIRRLKGTIKPRANPTKHELKKCVGRRSLVIKGLASLGLGQSTSISALLVLRSRFCRTPLLLRLRLL